MLCRDCARYDADACKCRDEKLNPGSWGDAIIVANAMGVRAICMFNDHRERLVRSRLEALAQFGRGRRVWPADAIEPARNAGGPVTPSDADF